VSLLLGLAQAPFSHVHRHDPGHRHAGIVPHTHMRLLGYDGRAFCVPDEDDDVQPVDWVLLGADWGPPLAVLVAGPFVPLPPVERGEFFRAPSPRAHDPPGLPNVPTRAPPV
jgi:hypothetical protein